MLLCILRLASHWRRVSYRARESRSGLWACEGATYHVPKRGVALHVTRRRRKFWVTSRDRTVPFWRGRSGSSSRDRRRAAPRWCRSILRLAAVGGSRAPLETEFLLWPLGDRLGNSGCERERRRACDIQRRDTRL
jgi:hypothetical protein